MSGLDRQRGDVPKEVNIWECKPEQGDHYCFRHEVDAGAMGRVTVYMYVPGWKGLLHVVDSRRAAVRASLTHTHSRFWGEKPRENGSTENEASQPTNHELVRTTSRLS